MRLILSTSTGSCSPKCHAQLLSHCNEESGVTGRRDVIKSHPSVDASMMTFTANGTGGGTSLQASR